MAAAVGWVRSRARRRWLRRVQRGEVAGWAIVVLRDPAEQAVGLEPVLDVNDPADAVLARCLPGLPSGAYRTGDRLEWKALVSSSALSSVRQRSRAATNLNISAP